MFYNNQRSIGHGTLPFLADIIQNTQYTMEHITLQNLTKCFSNGLGRLTIFSYLCCYDQMQRSFAFVGYCGTRGGSSVQVENVGIISGNQCRFFVPRDC